MRPERILRFEIAFCTSQRHKTQCVVVPPNEIQEADPDDIALKIEAFINFHLAIKPNVPVILFDIEDISDVGTAVYQIDLDGWTLYHLPERSYPFLQEFITETPYLISKELVSYLIEADKVEESIFASLQQIRNEKGLVILGLHR